MKYVTIVNNDRCVAKSVESGDSKAVESLRFVEAESSQVDLLVWLWKRRQLPICEDVHFLEPILLM